MSRVTPPVCAHGLAPGTTCFGQKCGLNRISSDGSRWYAINKSRFSSSAVDHLNTKREKCVEQKKRSRDLLDVDGIDGDGDDDDNSEPAEEKEKKETDVTVVEDLDGDDDEKVKYEPGGGSHFMGRLYEASEDDAARQGDDRDESDDDTEWTLTGKLQSLRAKLQVLLDESLSVGIDPDLCDAVKDELDDIIDIVF